ncbi:hypothetical protein DEJ49_17315 [Streptomyces venezuelae]|uniref:DUF7144 domain-containing protein n=1 Tax=Streptomyces venezuelae TaxID=54571 RepID=A0A5P2CLA8_STRVZ|nr:hypothetical protein [Streptomyces venezuelae]QES42498.1 hypothetical protein DEJ49_17315 [Streptomyces venezuelae]
MAEHARPQEPAAGPQGSQAGPLAVATVVFSVCVLTIVGSYHSIAGFAAIVDDRFFTRPDDYPYALDVTTWGWLHLIIGMIVLAAALTLLSGYLWARAVGVTVAGLSALECYFFTPYYPVWCVVMIALDVLVIWSLVRYARPVSHKLLGVEDVADADGTDDPARR